MKLNKELKELLRIKNLMDGGMDRKEYDKTHKELMNVIDEIVVKLRQKENK